MTLETMLLTMGQGMLRTCGIFFITLILSLPLGFLVYFGRVSRFSLLRAIVKVFISVMRGTPLMLQLLIWYFGPYYLFNMPIRNYRFTAIVLGFAFNYAAYFAEIYRGGIEAMPKGQYEAAAVLGYSRVQTFVKIILPQVIKNVLPSVTNEIITLVKDTSLAFTLAYQEVFSLAKQLSSANTSFVPFVIAGIFYYIFNYAVAFSMEGVEKALDYYR